jgi:hypothetical protein
LHSKILVLNRYFDSFLFSVGSKVETTASILLTY